MKSRRRNSRRRFEKRHRIHPGESTKVLWADSYLDHVEAELREFFPRGELKRAGYQIHTRLDRKLQESAFRELSLGLKDSPQGVQAGWVAIDNRTGGVLASFGGRHRNRGDFHRGIDAKRPVGSLAKPFVFGLGLERGAFDVTTEFLDEKRSYSLGAGGPGVLKTIAVNSRGTV